MNLPTKITLSRMLFIPVFIFTFIMEWWIISAVLFAALSLTDFLDGYVARKSNTCTQLGAFLDPIADKVLIISAMFLVVTLDTQLKIVFAILFMLCVARDQLISGFRLIGETKKITIKVDKLGKAKTCILNIALFVLILSPYHPVLLISGFIVTIIGTILSLISGTNYIFQNKSVLY